ncbi:MAG TPA: peptigoglycan-binding protein LysM [Gammaproteobacteria bacterium]|nr:peptigoglycan-binding protein LysM [Gammaproteobacteria bacterium]
MMWKLIHHQVLCRLCLFVLFSFSCETALPLTFEVTEDLIGELELASTLQSDTLSDIARTYDQGYFEMRWANPTIDPWLPGEDTEIIVPSLYVLPEAPRRGIVVNVPEMRLYFFSESGNQKKRKVTTHPISIGRQSWSTPHGATKVVAKIKNPNWYPPESIRAEHAAAGDPLPRIVPAGPENPLGAFAILLGLPGYLIHGTNRPYGIGMRVTHGCLRMYPKDVKNIFDLVTIGAPVYIVNQPYKVGIARNKVYLEVHPYLAEDKNAFRDQFSQVVALIVTKALGRGVQLNWRTMRQAFLKKSGIPIVIGGVSESQQVLEKVGYVPAIVEPMHGLTSSDP